MEKRDKILFFEVLKFKFEKELNLKNQFWLKFILK